VAAVAAVWAKPSPSLAAVAIVGGVLGAWLTIAFWRCGKATKGWQFLPLVIAMVASIPLRLHDGSWQALAQRGFSLAVILGTMSLVLVYARPMILRKLGFRDRRCPPTELNSPLFSCSARF